MKITLKKEGYVTDKKELQIILEDINDLLESSESDTLTDFLSDVKLFITTKRCCSIKQKQAVEDALVKRRLHRDWDYKCDASWEDQF